MRSAIFDASSGQQITNSQDEGMSFIRDTRREKAFHRNFIYNTNFVSIDSRL